jgi:rod shape-determining protein MreC
VYSDVSARLREGRTLCVLIPLLLLHVALLSLQIEDPRGNLLFRRWVLAAEQPFIQSSSFVFGGIARLWSSYVWLHGARSENEHLRRSVQELTLHVNDLQSAAEENTRLRQLLSVADTVQLRSVGARVVARTPDYLANVVYIDRGSDVGISPDCPVLSGTGVVGRVVLVSRFDAQVQLITNADASTGVIIGQTNSPGVLKGSGQQQLAIDYISNTDQVNVGDQVVTSGLDTIFPRGLLVGKVVESSKGRSVFRFVRVQPAADLLHLDDVLVIINKSDPHKTDVGKTESR